MTKKLVLNAGAELHKSVSHTLHSFTEIPVGNWMWHSFKVFVAAVESSNAQEAFTATVFLFPSVKEKWITKLANVHNK